MAEQSLFPGRAIFASAIFALVILFVAHYLDALPVWAQVSAVHDTGLHKKASLAKANQAGTIPAVHAQQQHMGLGKGDMYISGQNVKWIFNDGDVVCMYRGGERKVYLACPSKKAVFEQSFEQFRRRGIVFTDGGQESFKSVTLKPSSKPTEFQKFPAKTYVILARASAGHGEIRMIDVGQITALAQPTKTPEMAEFITLAYGLPKVDAVMLDMTTRFYVADGSLWFKTTDRDLRAPQNPKTQSRLRTMKLENTKVASDFFDIPKDYKKVASQTDILGMASAAKDFTDLMYAEPHPAK